MLGKSEIDILRSTVFFGALPDPVFDTIISQGRKISVDPEQSLFHRGEPAKAVFAVLEGLVKLSVTTRDGTEAVVEIFHAGTSFAEALAFRESTYPVTATALVKSRVFAVPNQAIQSTIAAHPEAFGAILGATYEHLHKLVRQIEQLKSSSGIERVGHFILASTSSTEAAGEIEIPYKKHVLASLLGMKPETLSRTFRRLQPHGVAIEGRKIILRDRGALLKLFEENRAA